MTTLTMPKDNDTKDVEDRRLADSPVRLLDRPETTEVLREAPVVTAATPPEPAAALPERGGLLARLLWPILVLYDGLSGTPMTEQQRRAHNLDESVYHVDPGLVHFRGRFTR